MAEKKDSEVFPDEHDSIYNIEDDVDMEKVHENSLEDDNEEKPLKRKSPFSVLVKVMFTPVEGWKELRRSHFTTDEVASRCFYPLIALAAFSDAANMIYEAHYSFGNWAVDGLITFITFFFGYFTVLLIGSAVLPRRSRFIMKTDIGRQFVMLCMSTLAIFWVLVTLLPMIDPVLVFLPLWTVYLIIKGGKILRLSPEVRNSTTGYLCLLIILSPLFWNWLFTEIILKDQ